MRHSRSLSILAHLSSGMTDRDAEIWVNPTSAKMQDGMQPAAPIDGVLLGKYACGIQGGWKEGNRNILGGEPKKG